jgi:putative ABC transport system permease protein
MIGPILRALTRRGATAALVILEVAFGLSVAVEAMVFSRYFDRVSTEDSRLDPGAFVVISELATADASPARLAELRARDLGALRAAPGVAAVAATSTVPRSRGVWSGAVTHGGKVALSSFFDGVDLLDTVGVPIARGRGLRPDDVGAPGPAAAVISPALAASFGGDVLGETLTLRGRGREVKVVGVHAEVHLVTSLAIDSRHTMVVADPVPLGRTQRYLVRPLPGQMEAARAGAAAALAAIEPRRVVSGESLQELRKVVERSTGGGVAIFSLMVFAVIATVLLGSLGMSSFLVAERVKQIGTRRALGATRGAIVKHFLLENWLTTSAGLIVGLPLTYGLARFARSLQPDLVLEPSTVVIGALLFWLTGLAAALVPALRAAAVPPSMATRTI